MGQVQMPPMQMNVPQINIDPPEFVTPESLLVYCQTRLRDLDGRIQEKFAAEQKAVNDQKALADLKLKMGKYSSNGANGDDAMNEMKDSIQHAIDVVSDPETKAALGNMLDAVNNNASKSYSKEEIKSLFIDPSEEAAKNLSQGRELSMIDLQSVVSQRQTALQLTTNLLNSVSESTKAITANMGK